MLVQIRTLMHPVKEEEEEEKIQLLTQTDLLDAPIHVPPYFAPC